MSDNIILVSIDTLRFDCIGYQDNKNELKKYEVLNLLKTPNLDNIGKKSICFTNAVSVSTYTTSAHASILTGLYPHRHGIRAFYDTKLSENVLSLAEILKKEGYITILSTDIIELFEPLGLTRGFSNIFVRQDKELHDFLNKNKDKKIFLFVHFFDVHEPYIFSGYETHQGYNSDYYDMVNFLYNRYNIEMNFPKEKPYEIWNNIRNKIGKKIDIFLPLYIKGITKFDQGRFKGFMDCLENNGYLYNSLLVIFSDHGEGRCSEADQKIFSHGDFPYENVIRVPLIIYYNGVENNLINRQVSVVDIFPTVLEKVLKKRPEELYYNLDGENLLSNNLREYVQGEVWGSNFNFYENDQGLRIPDKNIDWFVRYRYLRRQNKKYIAYGESNKFIVFDLEKDFEELNPILLGNPTNIFELRHFIGQNGSAEKIFKESTNDDEKKIKESLKKLGYLTDSNEEQEKMEEKTFEIKDPEINAKDIEKQIRENIINRKKSGIYANDLENIIKVPLLQSSELPKLTTKMTNMDSNWKIDAEYKISSHRRFIGKLLVWGRRLVNNEVRRYVDLLIGKQSEFNMHLISKLKDSNEKVDFIGNEINDINNKIDELEYHKVEDKDTCYDDRINYFLFEDRYRGSVEEIKKRQCLYLEYFKNCQNVLDIGCGRGEFLTLLKENNVNAKGIDTNDDMVLFCKKNNLDVEKIKATEFLQLSNNKSLDGIFSSQVIEHLHSNELINLIKLCYDKMQYGASIVIETINPLCLSAHSTFYKDLSHVRLIHPDTLKFVLESCGFRDVEIKFLNICADTQKLNKIPEESGDKNFEIINKNIDTLNSLLFGYQDYAIIAKK